MTVSKVKISILISSPQINETINLEGEEFIFGRNSKSSVYLNDPAFSRSHFKLTNDQKTLQLFDMGSSNGTFINGVQASPVNPERIIKGDVVTVNNSDIQITIQSVEWIVDPEEDDKTVIHRALPNLSSDSLNIDHLSEEIIREANLRVEQILSNASSEAQRIISEAELTSEKMIADKQARADQYLEKQVIEKKGLIKKDLELEKSKKQDEINAQLETDRKKLYADLEAHEQKIEEDHKKRVLELEKSLQVEILKIADKERELSDLDKTFAIELEKKNAELDLAIKAQKAELSVLSAEHEEEKKKQLQLMEAQFENKKFQLKEELDAIEAKVAAAQKEFGSLYDNYNTQKEAQIKTLEGLIAKKEQAISEIKTLNEELANQKILNAKFAADSKASIEVMQSEVDKFQKIKVENENAHKIAKTKLTEIQKNITDAEAEMKASEASIKLKKQQVESAEVELKKLASEKDDVMSKLAPLKMELNELIRKNEAATRQNNDLRAEHTKDVTALKGTFLQMKKDLEEEMRKRKEIEEERLQNLTRHELNQINKIKEDSLRIVLDLENSITKELSNATSKVFATTIGMTKFREIAPDFEKSIRTSLQAGVLKLLQNELTPADPLKKKTLSSTQKTWKPMIIGMSVSAIVFGGLPMAYQHVKEQNDPARIEREAQERLAAAPPIRKFVPEKVSKLGVNLVDSVIYTTNFYETITQEKFRSGLMKEGSIYLYKQWKIDEEKSIQSYSMILSLIDVLHEKAEKIDPDFEKRDIGKMTAMEKETMKKLEKILGNEVRIEAAMKFQNRYYQDYIANNPAVTESNPTN